MNGTSNLAGEYALFDPAQGDDLRIGGTYYFDKPGDMTTASQGWNAVYLGRQDNGSHQFWTSDVGVVDVAFGSGSSAWMPTSGFNDYYLGAAVADPNVGRLQRWDTTRSV